MGNRKKKRNAGPKSKPNGKSSSGPKQPAVRADNDNTPQETSGRPQMHHYVPRWILRKFSERLEDFNAPRGLETIYCYSVETGDLTRREVREAYAVADLYKDPRNPLDSYAIERKLGELEGHASRLFTRILKISETKGISGSPTFRMKREDLNNIRKFMFIMHYHQLSIAETYFQDDHPENANIKSWIRAFRDRNNLCPSDVWLFVLRYYLFTSHSDIMKHGSEAILSIANDARQSGLFNGGNPNLLEDMQKMEINPNLEHWESIAYSTQMGGLFLNIWKAAPGEEFVISSNSFGLYEGQLERSGSLHRFYVVSPKIVLVLCDVSLKPGHLHPLQPKNLAISMLMDAPRIPAKVDYHKKGKLSDRDVFELEISTLSAEQTHTINAIVLAHVNDTGTVTFRSEEAALRTLDAFTHNLWFEDSYKSKYIPLIGTLQEKLGKRALPLPGLLGGLLGGQNSGLMLLLQASKTAAPGKLWETHYEIYCMLQEGSDELCESYKEYENAITGATGDIFELIQQAAPESARVNATASGQSVRLVRSMDDGLASQLFSVLGGVIITGDPDLDGLNMFPKQVTIAVLDWLLQHDRRLFCAAGKDGTFYEPSLSKIREYINTTKSIQLASIDGMTDPASQPSLSKSTQKGTTTSLEESPKDSLEYPFLQYQNARTSVPGTFFEQHLEIYRLLHGWDYERDDYYRPHEEKAIMIMINRLRILRYPGSPNSGTKNTRPAQLIRRLEDHHAFLLFGYISFQLGKGGITLNDGPIFKEQIVIGVLDWLLQNWRAAFEEIERTILTRATEIQQQHRLPHLRGAPSERPNRYLRLSEDISLEETTNDEIENHPRLLKEPTDYIPQQTGIVRKSCSSDSKSSGVTTGEHTAITEDAASTQALDTDDVSSRPEVVRVKDEGNSLEKTKRTSRITMLEATIFFFSGIVVLFFYLSST